MRTLNNVISQIVTLALQHKQINHVYFGSPAEWLADKKDINYSACFIDLTGGTVSKDQKQTGFSLDLWFCNLVNVSAGAKGNELDVMSDLTSIAEDMAAMINYHEFEWTPNTNYPLAYYREHLVDVTIAVKMTIEIGIKFLADRCQVPTDFDFSGEAKKGFILTEDGEFILTEDNKKLKTE